MLILVRDPFLVEVIDQLQSHAGAQFASFIYRTKQNELAKYTLILGADTSEVYRKDLVTLDAMIPTLTGLELDAAMDIHSSLSASLALGVGNNPRFVHAATDERGPTYEMVEGLPGVKVHAESKDIHVMGLRQRKEVIEAGDPRKPVKSAPLTLAKKAIDRKLRRGDICQFNLGSLEAARMNGLEFGR